MIEDLLTVMWKEYKELLSQRGGVRTGFIPLLVVPIFLLGIFLPLQAGRGWVESPTMLLTWMWLSIFLVTSMVADSSAGERERHTLETLLASRLSDRAILLGKICATVGYGWGLTLASMLVGLVTVNLVYGAGGLLLYSGEVAFAGVILSILAAMLVASIGVLVSLRAPTVRHAQQTLSIGFMIMWFGAIFGAQAVPAEWRARLASSLAVLSGTNMILVAMALLSLFDIGTLLIVVSRFKRARLILD